MGTETNQKTDYDSIVEFLDKYEDEVGLKQWNHNPVVNEAMSFDGEQLKKMTAEECAEIAYQLMQYAAFLQRRINFEDSVVNWSNSKIELIVADKLAQYVPPGKSFMTYDEKKMLAIKGDDAARRLYVIKVSAENRLKRLIFLPKRIEAMANMLIELQYAKRSNK